MRVLASVLVSMAAAAVAAPTVEDIAAYRNLVAQDARLATVAYRLASVNAPFCKMKARNPGWVIHDLAQYPDQAVGRAAFGGNGAFQIAYVVPNGSAAASGLKTGDGLIRVESSQAMVDFEAIVMTLGGNRKQRGIEEALLGLEPVFGDQFADGAPLPARPITLTIVREGQQQKVALAPQLTCATYFLADSRTKPDAGADGEKVRVTTGLMDYVANDDELAAVVAHELSHNLLGHPAQLRALRRGKTAATYQTEIEADRLSVWLMVNAGYDPNAALTFWERYGRRFVVMDSKHPNWKKRVATMQAEIDLIGKTQVKDGLRDPPLLQQYRNQQ